VNREHDTDMPALLSIGALSRLSGVQIETIRNWERRYGWPTPIRLDSGHRRYPSELVPRLRLARSAVDLGFKPSYIAAAPRDELDAAVRLARESSQKQDTAQTAAGHENEIEAILTQVTHLDANRFETTLRKCWCKYGADTFICDLIEPLLSRIENAIGEERMTIVHEHFATELLSGFLVAQWRPLSVGIHPCKAVVTGLEGEHYPLPLHMSAIFLVIHNIEVVFLGPNTPISDIVIAARQSGAIAVAVQCAPDSDRMKSKYLLTNLRAAIPPSVTVAVGGFRRGLAVPGITDAKSMRDLLMFVRSLSEIHGLSR
jgi:MerR family transcriptional regulator, light-induced transcriptional regulator